MAGLLRRLGFFTRWEVLDTMLLGKWYYGLDLAKEHGFSVALIYDRLFTLEQDGFVESRRVDERGRRHYRKTGKRRKQDLPHSNSLHNH